jgi:hypothetical protein
MKYLKKYESISDIDINDILLDIQDSGFDLIKDTSEKYSRKEYIICKYGGDSGYVLNNKSVELFSLNEIIDSLVRVFKYNMSENISQRILVNDGQYLMDITSSLETFCNTEGKSDFVVYLKDIEVNILRTTHLHLKKKDKKDSVDLYNITYVAIQLFS